MSASLKFSCTFFCILIAGCGEGLGGLSGAVSIGGSGSGSGSPSSNTDITPPTTGEGFIEFLIYSTGLYTKNCGNLEISSVFLNGAGQEILTAGNPVSVAMLQSVTDTNVSIQVKVKNNSDYPVYDYRSNCSAPVTLRDSNQKIYNPQQDNTCQNTDDEYQIILPNETKTFTLKYSMPLKVQSWNLQYTGTHSLNHYAQSNERTACTDYSLNFNLLKN